MKNVSDYYSLEYPLKIEAFLQHYDITNYVIYIEGREEIRSKFYDENKTILIVDFTSAGAFCRTQQNLSEYKEAIRYCRTKDGDIPNPLYKEDITYYTARGELTYFGNALSFESATYELFEKSETKFDDRILKYIEDYCLNYQTRLNPGYNAYMAKAYGIDPNMTAKDANKYKRGIKYIPPETFKKPDALLHDKAFNEEMVCRLTDIKSASFADGAVIDYRKLDQEEDIGNHGFATKKSPGIIPKAKEPHKTAVFLNFPVINAKFGTNFDCPSGFFDADYYDTAIESLIRVIGEDHPEYPKIEAYLETDCYEKNQTIGVDCEFNSDTRELVSYQVYSAQLGIGYIYFYRGAYPELPHFITALDYAFKPQRIDFVAHFNHAEFSHFYDFGEGLAKLFDLQNKKAHARNAFLDMSNSIVTPRYERVIIKSNPKYNFSRKSEYNTKELILSIRDTYLVFNKEKLAKIGETLGIKKLDVEDNIERMNHYLAEDPLNYCRYAMKDAVICAVAIEDHDYRIHSDNLVKTKNAVLPETIPSISTLAGVYIQQKLDEIGEERYGIKQFSRLHQGYYKLSQQEIWDEGPNAYRAWKMLPSLEKEGEAYFGGRNECYTHGKITDGTTDFDIKNAYPTAMMALYTPNYRQPLHMGDIKIEDIPDIAIGSIEVAFKFKDNVMYPNFPIKKNNSLIFVRQSNGFDDCRGKREFERIQLMDFLYALRKGLLEDYEIKSFSYFPPVSDEEGRAINILGDVVSDLVEARYNASEPILKKYYKLLVNSAYGKLTQGINDMRKFNAYNYLAATDQYSDQSRAWATRSKVPKSAIFNPAVAAAITAFVRIIVAETMEGLHHNGIEVLSVTTDGFVVRGYNEANLNAKTLDQAGWRYSQIAREARSSRLSFENEESSLWEVKHYSLPGEDYYSIAVRHYFAHAVREDKEAIDKYQLAKGGIQTPRGYSLKRQSEYMISSYIDCNEKIPQSTLTSIQKTIQHKRTFTMTGKSLLKSWDYDLKRKPAMPSQTSIMLGDQTAEKVHFRSVPYKDINEYSKFRATLTKYEREKANKIQTCEEVFNFILDKLNFRALFQNRSSTKTTSLNSLFMEKIRLAAVASGLAKEEEFSLARKFSLGMEGRSVKTTAAYKSFMKRARKISIQDFYLIKDAIPRIDQAFKLITEALNGDGWLSFFTDNREPILKKIWADHLVNASRYFSVKIQV